MGFFLGQAGNWLSRGLLLATMHLAFARWLGLPRQTAEFL